MRIAILYKIQDYYVSILRYRNGKILEISTKDKLIFSQNDIEKTRYISSKLFKYHGVRKLSLFLKIYKRFNIDEHTVIAEYNLVTIFFYPLHFIFVKYKSKAFMADFRLKCRMRLISSLSVESSTLKDYLDAFCEYIIHDHYTLWIYNEVTKCFTFVAGTEVPDKQYIEPENETSLSIVLDDGFESEMRKPEDSDIVQFKENGMKSLTRISLRLGPHKQPAALSFYSCLDNFKIQNQVIKDIKSFVEMKYPEQLYGLSRALENITRLLDNNRAIPIEEYMHIFTEKVCSELEYEAASVFFVDDKTSDLRLVATYDLDHSGVPSNNVVYPKDVGSLTNEVTKNVKRYIVVYDLENVDPNSHIYDENTENLPTNWIGFPISDDNKALAVIRVKNKFIINTDGVKEIIAPRPSDLFNLTTLTNIVESHLVTQLKLEDLNKKLKIHDNLSKVYRHEIRGPISSIVEIPNELINVLNKSEISKSDINKTIKGLEDLGALTQNLAQVAKSYNIERLISDNDNEVNKLSLLGDLIIPIEKLTKNYYKTKYDSNIVIDHDSLRGATVSGKRELYFMVLYALLDNAGKYQLMESGDIKIYSDYKSTDDKITLYIENYGLEIFEAEEDSIFQNDGRGELARSYKIDGSGIGLWLCSNIMKKFNGLIEIDSRFNPVRFKLTFPRGDA